jgi:hypothetical protein
VTKSLSNRMTKVELLTVEDRFQLSGVGLTVVPDFPVPKGWANVSAVVTVVTPNGEEFDAVAQCNLTHFNFRSTDAMASIDRRWRILLSLPDVLKERVPVGSRIFVSKSVRTAVLGENSK